MQDRFFTRALLPFAFALIVAGCTNPLVISLAVSPTAQTLPVGQTAQFTATGTYGHGSNHPSSTQDETNQVTWTSSSPSVATISATGMATAVASGTTTITASINGFTGLVSATATVTVTGGSTGTGTITGISSLTVIPGSQTVAIPGDTTQFIAIGTSASGATADLSSQVAWKSASEQIATVVPNTGLATAMSQGSDTITAEYTNPNGGSTVTGTATFTVSGGTSEQFTAVTIVPSTEQISVSGQTAQLIALGTLGSSGLQEDVTNLPQTTWASSIPTIAIVTSGQATGNGVVSGKSAGQSTITVQLKNPDGSVVSNTASVTTTNTPAPEQILSLSIIPSSISVNNFNLTGQFLAIATYATPPYVRDVTNSPGTTWISTEPEMFPVDTNSGGNPGASAGLVTAYASGSAVIVAEATDSDGTIQTASATFSCPYVPPGVQTATNPGSCYPEEPAPTTLLGTLTVYNEGLNTTNWEVTAPSATGTANVLHCGPGWTLNGGTGGSVCTATYPVSSTVATKVVLTAPAGAGQFGGWSYNCTPSDQNGNPLTGSSTWTAAGPNYCVVQLGGTTQSNSQTVAVPTNVTVGAIFN